MRGLREDVAELVASKLGFEGRIGTCQRDREGKGSRVAGTACAKVRPSRQRQLTHVTE